MAFTVYVLKSIANSKRYVGCTGKNVKERLSEHNAGKTFSTKDNRPYKLIYFEQGIVRVVLLPERSFSSLVKAELF